MRMCAFVVCDAGSDRRQHGTVSELTCWAKLAPYLMGFRTVWCQLGRQLELDGDTTGFLGFWVSGYLGLGSLGLWSLVSPFESEAAAAMPRKARRERLKATGIA